MSRHFYWLPVEHQPDGIGVDYSLARTIIDWLVANRWADEGADEWTLAASDERLHGFLDGVRLRARDDEEREAITEVLDALAKHGEIRLFARR